MEGKKFVGICSDDGSRAVVNANPWEQRKLIEVCDYVDYRGKTPTKTENGIFLVTAKNVKDGFIDYETSKEYISENAYEEVMRRGKPEIGDVLITTEAPCGNVAQVNKADIALAQRIIKYRGHIGVVDNTYLKYYLLSPEFQKILNAKSSGGTVQGIKGSILHQQKIIYPSYEEQKKIGQHMDSLDHLITLHQRKCDEVKSLKKYMLQKMFPQNEQKVPEIRFEGFTEAWEQRKLGDLVDRVTRKNQDLVSELPLTISAQYGLIDQNEFFDKRVASKDVSGYYLIENGEFAYNKSTSTDAPWGAIKRLDRYENGVLSTLYIVFGIKENNPVDSDFLVSYYSTNLWHKGIHEIAAEGARNHGLLNIAPADFFETKLMIPQDIEEQKKIGKYFEELERLITLHQRKPIPHPNHPIIHTKHKGEEKYVRIRVNDREKTNRTANLRRFSVDISGGFKN
ncbi:restriction endonuclease subunit S [Blautia wexlerae]|uniref:restriction endonuclease subunit S n=1 Tax=Blautia wexlerae TaxID=418240 RepID=UPI00321C0BE2